MIANPNLDPKDPGDTTDYGWDFTFWLKPSGATIVTHSIEDDGLTVTNDGTDGKRVTALFSGGEAGQSYYPRVTITTSDGRTEVRTLTIVVQEL